MICGQPVIYLFTTGHTGAGWTIVRFYATAEALLRSRITAL